MEKNEKEILEEIVRDLLDEKIKILSEKYILRKKLQAVMWKLNRMSHKYMQYKKMFGRLA